MSYYKVVITGNYLELYEYEKEPTPHHIRKPRKQRLVYTTITKPKKTQRLSNRRRVLQTFKRTLRTNLNGSENPILLTLTFREIQTVENGYRQVTLFFQRCRHSFGKGFRYIAIPEFGKKATRRLHFHCIVWGFPPDSARTERTTRLLARKWGQGFLDCLDTDGHPKLIGYLAKYLSKAFDEVSQQYARSYSTSRNVLRPLTLKGELVGRHLKDICPTLDLSTEEPLQDRFLSTQWLGVGRYRLYNLSLKK